jgi:hypothetical protein
MAPPAPEDVERAVALIRKGSELGGHNLDDASIDRARRILTGELSEEDARAEMNAALAALARNEVRRPT